MSMIYTYIRYLRSSPLQSVQDLRRIHIYTPAPSFPHILISNSIQDDFNRPIFFVVYMYMYACVYISIYVCIYMVYISTYVNIYMMYIFCIHTRGQTPRFFQPP